MIRLLVTGGRDYADVATVEKVLRHYLKRAGGHPSDLLVIHGGAPGLDTLAGKWCEANVVPCISMRAPWAGAPMYAGPLRNSWMLKYAMPTHVYAFPGHRGTKNMIDQAIHAGFKVRGKYRKQRTKK